jgi:hypothetical protein
LLASGVATIIAPGIGGVYWLISSATLGVMVVMAVCDFRQDHYSPMRNTKSCL